MHRMFAYVLVGLALLHALDAGRRADGVTRRGAVILMLVIVGQAALGIFTLLWNVPIALALAHQLVAMLVLILATVHAANLCSAVPAEGRVEGRIVPSERLRAI
jgi:cytochrome c oxidase assembly protein subunit 15